MKHYLIYIVCLFCALPAGGQTPDYADNPAQYVNPFIGTANSGNTHPGAIVPWGMVSVSPLNVDLRTPGYHAVGYEYGHESFFGFSHVNLSGVGNPDMGSIVLMPATTQDSPGMVTEGTSYSHEHAEAGYYTAEVGPSHIRSEATATLRSGMMRFIYPTNVAPRLFIDLERGLSRNKGAVVRIVNDTLIEGYKVDGGFGRAPEHRVYFSMTFNRRPTSSCLYSKGQLLPTHTRRAVDTSLGVCLDFEATDEPLLVKTGISYVSVQNARLNRQTENAGWDFDQIRNKALDDWNQRLGCIRVSRENADNLVKFYTALYHMLIHPNIISDVNGEYPLMGERQGVGCHKDRPRFSVFSLWDTYRNVHPFLTLCFPHVQSQMLASMVDMYQENGWLPKWEIVSHESFTMVGDPAVPVIVDSYLKGIRDFDYRTAYEAMLKQGEVGGTVPNILRPGIEPYLRYGYIPQDDKGEEYVWGSVATALEYYLADWNIAQMAKAMNDTVNASKYLLRSQGYRHYWDADTRLLRPRMKDGSFMTPFDPLAISGEQEWKGSGGKGYVEGNAWQYTWFVPHDVEGLITLFGGSKAFVRDLQTCMDREHFTLWNEPDMAYPYLFNYVPGEEYRTQREVARCINSYFGITPHGLPGNDDTGTLSAWLAFSMMGFYPDCPGKPSYALTVPSFKNIEIRTDSRYYSGKTIRISRRGKSEGGRVKSIRIDGERQKRFFLNHSQLATGCSLVFDMK